MAFTPPTQEEQPIIMTSTDDIVRNTITEVRELRRQVQALIARLEQMPVAEKP